MYFSNVWDALAAALVRWVAGLILAATRSNTFLACALASLSDTLLAFPSVVLPDFFPIRYCAT